MCTLVVVEGVSNLVHYEVAVLEVTEQTVVDFDADVVFVLFQTKTAEVEVLHPVVVELHYHCLDVLVLDYLAQFQPARPKTRKGIQYLNEYSTSLLQSLLFLQHQAVQVQVDIGQGTSLISQSQISLEHLQLRVGWGSAASL